MKFTSQSRSIEQNRRIRRADSRKRTYQTEERKEKYQDLTKIFIHFVLPGDKQQRKTKRTALVMGNCP